ncbi:MAG: hypothetical protein ACK4VW_01440 [Anaerolineales bacterium]
MPGAPLQAIDQFYIAIEKEKHSLCVFVFDMEYAIEFVFPV